VCGNSARTDLRGGTPARAFPTATTNHTNHRPAETAASSRPAFLGPVPADLLLRASVRRHRRAQGGSPTLRSIRPKRATRLSSPMILVKRVAIKSLAAFLSWLTAIDGTASPPQRENRRSGHPGRGGARRRTRRQGVVGDLGGKARASAGRFCRPGGPSEPHRLSPRSRPVASEPRRSSLEPGPHSVRTRPSRLIASGRRSSPASGAG
jgi:hypothetical protein